MSIILFKFSDSFELPGDNSTHLTSSDVTNILRRKDAKSEILDTGIHDVTPQPEQHYLTHTIEVNEAGTCRYRIAISAKLQTPELEPNERSTERQVSKEDPFLIIVDEPTGEKSKDKPKKVLCALMYIDPLKLN